MLGVHLRTHVVGKLGWHDALRQHDLFAGRLLGSMRRRGDFVEHSQLESSPALEGADKDEGKGRQSLVVRGSRLHCHDGIIMGNEDQKWSTGRLPCPSQDQQEAAKDGRKKKKPPKSKEKTERDNKKTQTLVAPT